MYIKIENNVLLWQKWEFEGSKYFNADFDTFDPLAWLIDGDTIVPNPDYEAQKAQREKERIAKLSLTRGDVFRGLLTAKQVTRAQLRADIASLPLTDAEKEYALIDFDEALEFYRGNALVDIVGQKLGISEEQMTKFFETNDWRALVNEEGSGNG